MGLLVPGTSRFRHGAIDELGFSKDRNGQVARFLLCVPFLYVYFNEDVAPFKWLLTILFGWCVNTNIEELTSPAERFLNPWSVHIEKSSLHLIIFHILMTIFHKWSSINHTRFVQICLLRRKTSIPKRQIKTKTRVFFLLLFWSSLPGFKLQMLWGYHPFRTTSYR